MKFVKTADLKIGMRLAKPIYNKKGVLLYDRNSRLTSQGIESVRNFHLIGLFVLEPAEPLPPLLDEDMEFEKFQMVSVFSVEEELQNIITRGKSTRLFPFAETVVSKYGHLDHKINFIQNLRSGEDFVYKHSLNVAILVAMIGNKLRLRGQEQTEAVVSALVHDIGKLKCPTELLVKEELDDMEEHEIIAAEYSGIAVIESALVSSPNVKRTVMQAYTRQEDFRKKINPEGSKMVMGAKILMVAEQYDRMTAISSTGEPHSELAAIRSMRQYPEYFDTEVVSALVASINLLGEGVCVELSNGEKALIISSNDEDILKPMLLCFSTNTIIDLRQTALYSGIEIVDVMKTLDNRYVMKKDEEDNSSSDNTSGE